MMSVFYRICPFDSQTCSNRACLTEPRTETCPSKSEPAATKAPSPNLVNPAFCPNCGTDLAHGMPHAPSCPKAPQAWDYFC